MSMSPICDQRDDFRRRGASTTPFRLEVSSLGSARFLHDRQRAGSSSPGAARLLQGGELIPGVR